jgi:CheY-like chemotaxis protein
LDEGTKFKSRPCADVFLSPSKYARTEYSPHRALTCVQTLFYTLVIADWRLPDGDGIYLADRAVTLGAQSLIITGHLFDRPPGVANRYRF